MQVEKTKKIPMKKPVGIDFDSLPVKKKEKKVAEVSAEPIYLEEHYNSFKESKNSKIFEEIVDMMMLDYFDESFKKKIQGLSNDKKRMMILALLDKERNLFMKAKALIPDNYKKVPKLQHIKELILILREYVQVGEIEKKKHGEVMTPLDLVKDMIVTLPEEVWSNPNLKWLDCCNGTGPFLAMVVYKLMQGLKNWEPDEDKRYKHIMENMIYAGELQPKNMFLWITLMDPYNELNMNVYCGSFLDGGFDKHMKEVWGIEKFDIVIGNPPYQEVKDGNTKSQSLWNLFVIKVFSILKEGGYINYVHPGGWRNVDGMFKKVQLLLRDKEILVLKMHTFKEGLDNFKAKINYDYYCIRNKKAGYKFKTRIICEDRTEVCLNLSDKEFIPGENIEEIYSLVAKEGEEKVTIINNSSYHHTKDYMSREETDINKHPCVYMVSFKDVPNIHYSSINNKGHFGSPKVIWAAGSSGVIIDKEGKYAMTEFASGLVEEPENLDNVFKALKNEHFIKKIMLFKNGLGDKYNRKIIATFRKDFWKKFQ